MKVREGISLVAEVGALMLCKTGLCFVFGVVVVVSLVVRKGDLGVAGRRGCLRSKI